MADAGSSTKLPASFGKYLLTDLLAVGGMAEVYRAKIFGASGFEKDMVVKRILPRFAQNPSFIQMLIDEAKIAVSLTHGNIVPIYELGELESSYYIAMEYVEGRTILDVLRDAHVKKRALQWPWATGIVAEVARGLAYAHARKDGAGQPLGLVHRDINPRNIVVTPAGEVKILDFGIARATNKRHQTASGVIKGTPGYMSPEQMYGRPIDARSDLYCTGILLFELLTLRRLFPVWDVNEMRAVFEAGPVPRPSTIVASIPAALDDIVMRALAPRVDDRYQNAADLEEALRTVMATSGVAVTASGLARELRALDDAPGPRAPRTQPHLALAEAAGGATTSPIPRSSTASSSGASSRLSSDAPSIALPAPPSQPSGTAASHEQTRPLAAPASPRTQALPASEAGGHGVGGEAALPDAAHSFVISLAMEDLRGAAVAAPLPPPLPHTSAAAAPRTHVLAQNGALAWTQKIGDDAEMLALAKALGTAPGAGRRTVLWGLLVVVVVGVGAGLAFGNEIESTLQRALSGRKQETGSLVVKTRPSGAEVFLDGERKGTSSLKVRNVDVDTDHELEVRAAGKPPIMKHLTRKDFVPGEGGEPTFVLEQDWSGAPQLPTTTP